MTYELQDDVVIDRPPESVWPYVARLELDRQWRRPYVTELEADGDPLALGTRITGTTVAFGMTDTYRNEITEVVPHQRLAWRGLEASGGLIGVRGAYDLEPCGAAATRFRLTITYDAKGLLGRVLAPVQVLFLRRVVAPRFMRQIRELVEATEA